MKFLYDVFPYIIPVLVGAGIGYLTNVLAIKMLFRPLAEKRIFGIRVPLTPGILPRNRKRLAESLGNTVAQELLSPEVIRERLADPEFRGSVKVQVAGFLDGILEVGVGELISGGKGKGAEAFREAFERALCSDGAKAMASGVASFVVEYSGGVSVRDIVSPESAAEFLRDVVSRLEGGKARLHEALDAALSDDSISSKPFSDFLPRNAREIAERLFLAIYPTGFKALLSWLESEDARDSLAERGRELTDIVIARLPTVQKLVISLAGYRQKLHEEMPDIVLDLVDGLRKEGSLASTSKGLAQEAGNGIGEFVALPIREIEKRNPGTRTGLHSILDYILDMLGKVDVRDLLEKILSGAEGGIGERTLIDVAVMLTMLDKTQITEKLEGFLFSLPERFLRRGEIIETRPAVFYFPEDILKRTPGDLLGLRGKTRDSIETSLSDLALEVLEKKTSKIVETVDIRKVVVDRVNSLEMVVLERIVLDVMKEQFFWIDIFGGLLGGIIGAFQVGLSILLR